MKTVWTAVAKICFNCCKIPLIILSSCNSMSQNLMKWPYLSILKKSKTFFPAPAWPPVMLPGFPKNKIIFCFFTFYHCARIKFFLLNWIILRFFTFYHLSKKYILTVKLNYFTFLRFLSCVQESCFWFSFWLIEFLNKCISL